MNVLKLKQHEKERYEKLKKKSDNLRLSEQSGEMETPTFPELLEDTFHSLYNRKVEFEDDVDKAFEPNKQFLKETFKTREFKELHELTQRDEFFSAMAAMGLAERFNRIIPENEKEKISDNKKAQEIMKQTAGTSGVIFENYNIDWDKVRQEVRESLKQVEEEVAECEALLSTCGSLDHSFPQKEISFDKASELVTRIKGSYKLKHIMELGGRFKNIALNKRMSRTDKMHTEISDIEIGNNISRLTPLEMVMCGDSDYEDYWDRRYMEGQLQQWKLDGIEKLGKGPIIILDDESYSMKGNRERFVKAMMYPMAYIAKEDNRNLAVVRFGDRVYDWFTEVQEKPELLMQLCEEFLASMGTNFDDPMWRALEIIKKEKYTDADIFYLTDGVAGFTDKMRELIIQRKEELGFNVYAVIIGCSEGKQAFDGIADGLWTNFDFMRDGDDFFDTAFLV